MSRGYARESDQRAGPTLESGLEALHAGSEFGGPVERLDDHRCNDHFAHVYETPEEKFAAAVPFVRHGLDRGERLMYVVDESSEAEVRAALCDGGIDVGAATESGALTFHTVQETYLRGGTFDVDEMIEFYGDAVAAATEEYAALRIVAEMTWIPDDDTSVEQFMEYEQRVNDLFDETESLAVCQYNRDLFAPEAIRSVVQSHPHLIYDGAACHNFYYTPPEEFFDDDVAARENDRMLRTLRERTEAKAELHRRERFLEDLYDATADATRSFEATIRRLLELGTERFGLDIGYFTQTTDDAFEIVAAVGDHDVIEAGVTDSLTDTYCEKLLASPGPIAVRDASEAGWTDDAAYERFGLDAYFATTVRVGGEEYGTLCFASEVPHREPFSDADRTFLDLMGQWLEAELERRRRERFLRESYRITSDLELSFEEKLGELLDLGCDWMGLDAAGLTHLPEWSEKFLNEYTVGYASDADGEVWTDPGEGCYCREVVESDHPVGMADVRGTDWEDDEIYREQGLACYLGTKVTSDSTPYGTLWFGSTEPRDREFTDTERTFVELIGQWVSYELERREHVQVRRRLYEITSDPDLGFEAKLERLLEVGCERFGLEMAGLNHLPEWDGEFRLEKGVGLGISPEEELWTDPGNDCYCRRTIAADESVGRADVRGTDWTEDPVYREFGVTSYFGTKVSVGAAPYGTLWFGSTEPRDHAFSEAEHSLLELMGQWVSYELERREHNQSQRELYEITADTELSTAEKIERLLDVGRDRLDLPVGMLTRERESAFEIERMFGSHPDLDEGTLTPPLTDNYCRRVVDTGESISVGDAGAAGWDGDALYHEFDLRCYAGTQVTVGGDAYGTVCFTDTSSRDEFTDAEHAFIDLLGQCVSYELERATREDRLHALSALGRQLLDTETAADVADCVVDTVEDESALPVAAAVALYDDETGELRPVAHTDAAAELVEASLFDAPDGPAWTAFVDGDPERVRDPLSRTEDAPGRSSVTEVAVYPLGTHGVFLAGATAPNGFLYGAAEIIETAAANVRAALARADRERALQEREDTLEEQNQTLSRLNRINDTIRRIDQALVEADTRDEIERVVCEELADSGPYEMAWVGNHDSVAGEITPSEWAGAEKGYLDDVTITTDDAPEGDGPTGRAVETGEPQVVNSVLTDESFAPWRQSALNRGYQATAAFPLTYEDTRYGVLNLYAGQPEVFDDLEREVLSELSNTIAYAINAVESKKALVSAEVTELDFRVAGGLPTLAIANQAGCDLRLETCIPRDDGSLRVFFSTRGAPAADVLAAAADLPADELTLVTEYEEDGEAVALFEASVTGESLCRAVLDHGGVVRRLTASDGEASVGVELPSDANLREFVDMFRTKFPESELLAQRTRERDRGTLTEFSARLREEFTERQFEVLETAYYSGFFETPRPRNGGEIAESLGVTQPTFNYHLRAGHRKLCRLLFEEGYFRNVSV